MLYDTIRVLREAGHEVPLIITCRAAPEYQVKEADFEVLAGEVGATFLNTPNINSPETIEKLCSSDADVAVSVNWINVIEEPACKAFKYGILNAHAGDLPRYRGNAPVAWAILNGEERVGVTIHAMEPGSLDSGPIYMKDYFLLGPDTAIGQVMDFLDFRIPRMFRNVVDDLAAGHNEPVPQPTDPLLALRCYPRRPEDGRINWHSSSVVIGRLIRASSDPFEGAFTFLEKDRLTVWRARLGKWDTPSLAVPGQVIARDPNLGEVSVATSDGLVHLQQVSLGHGKRSPASVVIKSLRARLR